MSDEPTTDVDEPSEPAAEAPEEAPEPTPDPLAERQAELDAKAAELAKKEKDLGRGFQEIAERERALTPKEDKFAGTPDLDEDSRKLLDKYIDSKLGNQLGLVERMYVDMANSELERFAEAKGIDVDVLKDTIRDYGLAPTDDSIASMRSVFDRAAKVVKASEFDEESYRKKVEDEVRESLLKQYAEQGVSVDAITPTRTEPSVDASLDDPNIDSTTKTKLLQEKHADWFRRSVL